MIRVAINGYGRIGRLAHRIILEKYLDKIEVVGINAGSSTDVKGWFYLLKYDTVYGPLSSSVISSSLSLRAEGLNSIQDLTSTRDSDLRQNDKGKIGSFVINGKEVPVFSQKDPSFLPWKDLEIDIVIESTGAFRTEEKLKKHIEAGARGIVISAPSKDEIIPTFVLSVNQETYKGENIISNASCTTNCIAPVAKIMLDNFGVEKAMMTTIHGYTSDQRLQDGGHKDYRRARAAGENIVPTSTGACKATGKVLPELKDKFTGIAIRVPVITGSLADFTFVLSKQTSIEEVNEVFRKESKNPLYAGILDVTEDPIVSSDIIGNPYSSIVDLSLTQVVGGNMVKIIAWYDNEFGYANRLVEETLMVANKLKVQS